MVEKLILVANISAARFSYGQVTVKRTFLVGASHEHQRHVESLHLAEVDQTAVEQLWVLRSV